MTLTSDPPVDTTKQAAPAPTSEINPPGLPRTKS